MRFGDGLRVGSDALRGRLEVLLSQHSQLLLQVKQKHFLRYALQPGSRVTRSDVAHALKPGEIFLDYFLLPSGNIVCFKVEKDQDKFRGEAPPKVDSDEVEAAVRNLWQFLDSNNGILFQIYPDQLNALSDLLIGPISLALAEYETVLICPHLYLAHIPFWALPLNQSPAQTVLNDARTMSIVPSASALVYFRGKHPVQGKGYVGMGVDGKGDIPLVELEVQLAEMRHFPGGATYVGSECNLSRLLEDHLRVGILHIASHAFSEPPALLLWGKDGPEPLSLNDALHRLETTADVVILDGCFTGRINLSEKAEFMGLARGFMVRCGAQSMVVSLWECGELSGLLLSDVLLRQYAGGMSIGKSLRAANDWLMKCTVGEVQEFLMHDDVLNLESRMRPDIRRKLKEYRQYYEDWDPNERAFPHMQLWAPFFLLGDPDVWYNQPASD